MSCLRTLDAQKFQKYFFNAPLLAVPGRTHPVEISIPLSRRKTTSRLPSEQCSQIHASEGEGDILLFLTGEEEIEDACRRIGLEVDDMIRESEAGPMTVYPSVWYSPAPAAAENLRQASAAAAKGRAPQTEVHRVHEHRRDVAHHRRYRLRRRSGLQQAEDLQPSYQGGVPSSVSPISKASAQQRAGRAGRTRPGKCFRLYTEGAFKKELIEQTYPEDPAIQPGEHGPGAEEARRGGSGAFRPHGPPRPKP